MRPFFVPKEVWETLSWKEQDFLSLLEARQYTKREIMRKLYVTTEVGYWKLAKRVRAKLNAVNGRGDKTG